MSHYNRFHSNTQHCPPFCDIPPRSIAFPSVNERYTLSWRIRNRIISHITRHYTPFLNSPLHFATTHNVLLPTISTTKARFTSNLLRTVYCITANAIPGDSPRFYSIPHHSTTFHCIPFCEIKLHSFQNRWGTLYCVPVHMIPVHFTTFYSIPEHLSLFCCVPFNQRELHLRRDHSGSLHCVSLHAHLHQRCKIALNSTKFHHVV